MLNRLKCALALLGALVFVFLVMASSQELFGQGLPLPYARLQFFTNAGAVCNGCTLTSSLTGTATASTLYTDSALTVPAGTASVVTLDSSGRPSTGLFMDTAITYRLVLKTSAGVQIWSQDGVRGSPTTSFTVTNNQIPKGTSTGTSIQDTTCLSESGTTVTVSGSCTLSVTTISGATKTRFIPNVAQDVVISSGAPVTTVSGTGVTVVTFGGTSAAGVTTAFQVPPDASVTSAITLSLTYSALVAPGATANKVKLKLGCTVNGTALATTAGDTITLANNTTPASYTGTVNIIAGSAYAVSDAVLCTILRDITVANNFANDFQVRTFGFTYVSTQ